MKSGFGTYALQTGPLKVGALVAVNALGDVYGPDGRPAAGLLNEKRTSLSCTLEEMFADIAPAENLFAGNTTLGVVVTNGMFDKTPLTKLAGMAHNGYARAIRPVHTTADGDSIYALSLGDVPGDINVVGAMARPDHGAGHPAGGPVRRFRLWADRLGGPASLTGCALRPTSYRFPTRHF